MNYKIVSPETVKEFESYYYLRWELLRKPLNKKLGTEKDSIENSSIHRMVTDKNCIIAVGRLHHNNLYESQVRYFAVKENYRNQGIGRYLMNDLENIAKKRRINLRMKSSFRFKYPSKPRIIIIKYRIFAGNSVYINIT